MNKNVIWLKNELNMKINEYTYFGVPYTRGVVAGLREALRLIEELDSVDNDVKIRKRMDTLQHQIDDQEQRIQDLENFRNVLAVPAMKKAIRETLKDNEQIINAMKNHADKEIFKRYSDYINEGD